LFADASTILPAIAPECRKAVIFLDEGVHRAESAAGIVRPRQWTTGSGQSGVHRAQAAAGNVRPRQRTAGSDQSVSVLCDVSTTFAPSESAKTLETVQRMLEVLTTAQLDRGDLVIVIGGGVLGDLGGFAAATYRRGVRWMNMPTTLLAMVDASVGGKTGANLFINGSLKKNMVGAFWQPSLVLADIDKLATLGDRHYRAGLAECIKHGMLSADFGDPTLGAWTLAHVADIGHRVPRLLIELIARNVAVKARVVGTDEREEAPNADGGRALLNLGHTFGHAIETLPNLSPDGDPGNAPLHHGEAVALGLVAASATAERLGIAPSGTLDQTRSTLIAAGLPTSVRGLPPTADLLALMMHDKKVAQGRLRVVLPSGAGRCRVIADPDPAAVEAGWATIRAG
jgi:3-dehydroquinate synthase